ncbi:UDP-N-acetylglucosamine diphosphorylase [Cantharellus anzutake]|uniref:UDP-N-acetylglucosamine diphosphorylase n=1 Tax=Cantharellus anzutake TaxID=1750568 RepID=UPI0019031009|nr:UDP-N-acetylglucosamine diphosphorylase [Cantharellus anzutake]XP_038919048.1 UDP-N-acetylglucosamine diphosphorylase [Cantharellus anzutake]KAF8317532.1 UDP-N-acetylglucosamine diphosphorylase [Cantharellus anzutake]KAF8335995.1 UDP-N-acetylglucosamine diphosphorylase [Cantharellus anzutake]
MSSYERLKERYLAANQSHVFTYWDRLNEKERDELLHNLNKIDIERANRIFAKSTHPTSESGNGQPSIEPFPDDSFDTTIGEESVANVESWRKIGLDAIGAGKVGALLMAGGQGTRLGNSDPKGCYDIGLPSHKPLFQIQAERILRLQTLAERELGKPVGSVIVPWYVMTSRPTRPATVAFFEKHQYFGLSRSNVIFFEQGTLPCFSPDGKVIMASPTEIATAPDGNGGYYAGLRAPLSPSDPDHTGLSDLKSRGVEYLHAYAVDNCLVRVADPVFVGYNIWKHADCAAKVIPKATPDEGLGVIALKGGVFTVVEYTEITREQAERKDPNHPDRLAFRAGSIANFFYTRTFLEEVESFESQLAFHIAQKKVPYCPVDNPTGETIKPSKPNGIKLELFAFDAFSFAKRVFVLEVDRKEEFSPFKNPPGTGYEDPDTSRTAILAQQKRFLQRAGASVADGVVIEISPLVSYAGEGLEAAKGKTYVRSGFVESVEELDGLA